MKPLRSGQVRTELAAEIERVLNDFIDDHTETSAAAKALSALIGGALEETITQLQLSKADHPVFWRIFTHSLWSLVRSLQASGKLKEIK